MADFDPPFAHANSEKRPPTALERDEGIPCGPADRNLFNFLFYCLQAEINEVIKAGGLTPSDSSKTQLRDAILALMPNFVNTNTFLNSINGDSDGGAVDINSNGEFVMSHSDGRVWTLRVPRYKPESRALFSRSESSAAGIYATNQAVTVSAGLSAQELADYKYAICYINTASTLHKSAAAPFNDQLNTRTRASVAAGSYAYAAETGVEVGTIITEGEDNNSGIAILPIVNGNISFFYSMSVNMAVNGSTPVTINAGDFIQAFVSISLTGLLAGV